MLCNGNHNYYREPWGYFLTETVLTIAILIQETLIVVRRCRAKLGLIALSWIALYLIQQYVPFHIQTASLGRFASLVMQLILVFLTTTAQAAVVLVVRADILRQTSTTTRYLFTEIWRRRGSLILFTLAYIGRIIGYTLIPGIFLAIVMAELRGLPTATVAITVRLSMIGILATVQSYVNTRLFIALPIAIFSGEPTYINFPKSKNATRPYFWQLIAINASWFLGPLLLVQIGHLPAIHYSSILTHFVMAVGALYYGLGLVITTALGTVLHIQTERAKFSELT